MKIRKHRDLTLVDINEWQTLVISCDSSGAIGDKEHDLVKVSPEIVGYFAAQVAMMEMLSFGGKPITIIDTLSVEMEPTGQRIINGIKEALEPLKFDMKNILTGSTEENFPISLTSMGITIIVSIDRNKFVYSNTNFHDIAVVVGIPKIGNEVMESRSDIMSIKHLLVLKSKKYINEILPVGSKGIFYELDQMAKSNGLNVLLEKNIKVNMSKSAGPSTCAIVSLNQNNLKNLKQDISLPIERIGSFTR